VPVGQGSIECTDKPPDKLRVVEMEINEAGRNDLNPPDGRMGREMVNQGLGHLKGRASETFAEPKRHVTGIISVAGLAGPLDQGFRWGFPAQ
jgi:hypothetical protein